jgi:hypothetical protein
MVGAFLFLRGVVGEARGVVRGFTGTGRSSVLFDLAQGLGLAKYEIILHSGEDRYD